MGEGEPDEGPNSLKDNSVTILFQVKKGDLMVSLFVFKFLLFINQMNPRGDS